MLLVEIAIRIPRVGPSFSDSLIARDLILRSRESGVSKEDPVVSGDALVLQDAVFGCSSG